MRLPYEVYEAVDDAGHERPLKTTHHSRMHEAAMAQAAHRTAQDPVGELAPAASRHNPSRHL
ncbi:hypothetical protein LMG27177_00829 [Paraburkholderia fynbosensis]|uniref:Uncharacterized protein n=1 Tax=Paraburkholderia fynbosensis TaxID=1200993 RepID=A0A6J5FGR2_9BURK|nr:hypothetical protein LMG27177_00829 [Paraburkholderia fynbosensis]